MHLGHRLRPKCIHQRCANCAKDWARWIRLQPWGLKNRGTRMVWHPGTAGRLGRSRLLSDGTDSALDDPVKVTDLDEQPQFEISLRVVVLESRLRQGHQKPSVGSRDKSFFPISALTLSDQACQTADPVFEYLLEVALISLLLPQSGHQPCHFSLFLESLPSTWFRKTGGRRINGLWN